MSAQSSKKVSNNNSKISNRHQDEEKPVQLVVESSKAAAQDSMATSVAAAPAPFTGKPCNKFNETGKCDFKGCHFTHSSCQ